MAVIASNHHGRALRAKVGTTLAIALLCLANAGCGQPNGGTSNGHISAQADGQDFSDRLGKATPAWRSAILLRAVTDSDRICDRVEDAAFQQRYRGMGMWRVRCHDGGDWAVFIGPQGNAQVAQCAALGAGVPQCIEAKKAATHGK